VHGRADGPGALLEEVAGAQRFIPEQCHISRTEKNIRGEEVECLPGACVKTPRGADLEPTLRDLTAERLRGKYSTASPTGKPAKTGTRSTGSYHCGRSGPQTAHAEPITIALANRKHGGGQHGGAAAHRFPTTEKDRRRRESARDPGGQGPAT